MGAAAMAANAVASSIAWFINVPGSAFSMGVMILVGHRIGRGEVSDVKKTIIFGTVTGALMMGVICWICMPFVGGITALYHLSPDASLIFRNILFINLVVTPLLWTPAFVPPAGLRATGDVIFTMVLAIFSMWAFRIVSGYIFGVVMGLGVQGVWLGMYVDWFVRSAVFLWRLLSGRWERRLNKAKK